MTKLTPAQAYAAQAKADRRAAAAERRGTAIQADNARVAELFKTAESETRVERLARTAYTLSTLETIADPEVRERCLKLAAVWSVAEPTVPFPGVVCSEDRLAKDGRQNWYLDGDNLPADLPAMVTNNGRLTQLRSAVGHPVGRQGYRYSTVTVRTALQRALKGAALFNYGV
jgi:hypothetical protein